MQLGYNYLAAHLYAACLAAPPHVPSQAEAAVPSVLDSRLSLVGEALDVRREAAYNYVLLLRASGNHFKAAAITLEFLSYD